MASTPSASGKRKGRSFAIISAGKYSRRPVPRPRREGSCEGAPAESDEAQRQQDRADTFAGQGQQVQVETTPQKIEDGEAGQNEGTCGHGAPGRRRVEPSIHEAH